MGAIPLARAIKNKPFQCSDGHGELLKLLRRGAAAFEPPWPSDFESDSALDSVILQLLAATSAALLAHHGSARTLLAGLHASTLVLTWQAGKLVP